MIVKYDINNWISNTPSKKTIIMTFLGCIHNAKFLLVKIPFYDNFMFHIILLVKIKWLPSKGFVSKKDIILG